MLNGVDYVIINEELIYKLKYLKIINRIKSNDIINSLLVNKTKAFVSRFFNNKITTINKNDLITIIEVVCKDDLIMKNFLINKYVITNSNYNLIGKTFGKLMVVAYTDERKGSYIVYKCKCKCGNFINVSSKNLRSGNTKSCGCNKYSRISKVYSKKKYNYLQVYSYTRIQALDRARDMNMVYNTNIGAIKSDKPYKNNSSGFKGVYFYKNKNKWSAEICFKKTKYKLGYFENIEDAIKTRKLAEENLFGNFLEWYYNEHPEKNKEPKIV